MSVSSATHLTNQHTAVALDVTATPQTAQPLSTDKKELAGLVDKIKKTIDALGDGLKALDISERESLRPMWGVLKEGLDILNGEPDDWDFSSDATQGELKQLTLLLNLHAKKFTGYINTEQQKMSGLTSFGKVCTILAKICESLSSEITKFAQNEETVQQIIQTDSDSSMSKLEFLTFKTKLSTTKSSPVDELIQQLNQTWAYSISGEAATKVAFDFSSGSGLHSETLDKLIKIHKELTEKIDSLEVFVKNNNQQLDVLTSSKENLSDYQRTITHMKQVKSQLGNRLSMIKDYQSPDTKEKICSAKKIEIRATINVLKSQKSDSPNIKTLITTLEKRFVSAKDFSTAEYEKEFTTAQLLGKKEIKGIGKLFNFSFANKQECMLRHMASQITDPKDPDSSSLATEYFTERMLMQSVLEKVGIKDASKQLKASISQELNSSEWSTIESKFTVPIEDKAHSSKAAAVVATTTKPAGQIFSNPDFIHITSKDSPITASALDDYKHTDNTGKTVTGGFNSHCDTEVNHVTTAAATSCTVNGEEVFGATRHGTLAPYGLDAAGIKSIPNQKLGQTIHSLFRVEKPDATRITVVGVNYPNSAAPNPALDAPNDPLREKFVSELSKILLATANGQRDSEAMKVRVQQLMTDPSLQSALAGLVKANPVLGELMQRQAALNRAREVFILEMTRNPKCLEQIQTGETVMFTSVGLLTPDNIRHQLHKLFGFSASSDEKAMVMIQAQAWKDLEAEINAHRIIINNHVVKADIAGFNFGVNKGATVMATNPVIGEDVSGWNFVNEHTNNESMIKLQTNTENRLKKKQTLLNEKITQRTTNPPTDPATLKKLDNDIQTLTLEITTISELSQQINEIWKNGSYRDAGNEPYKLPSRIALLSHLLSGGTVFNCKSGKDRTAQLDAEVKFLAFQIRTSNGKVPKPDRKRTYFEKVQFATFIFFDESRRKMQEFNTGYGGSKLFGQPKLTDNFTPSTGDIVYSKKNKAATIQQFQGLSKAVRS